MFDELIEKLKVNKWLLIASIAILTIGGGFCLLQEKTQPTDVEIPKVSLITKEQDTPNQPVEPIPSDNSDTSIVVDIKGAIQHEGVYELKEGQRLQDLVIMAGGLLSEADTKSINLAQKLRDEDLIYIARKGEELPLPIMSNLASPTAKESKVNLNTATLEQLQTITGIGAKRAQDILDYRDEHGYFQHLDDLKNVSGIGDKTFEKIQEEITLD